MAIMMIRVFDKNEFWSYRLFISLTQDGNGVLVHGSSVKYCRFSHISLHDSEANYIPKDYY